MIATEISGQPGNLVSSDYTHQAHPTRVDFPSPVQVFQADRFSILSPAAPSIQEDSQVNPVPVADGEEGVIPLPKVNWEHHGPWSWASVCSQPGVKWVCAKLRSDEFLDTANGLTKTWSKRLKMKRFHQFETKALEPDAALAWKYVKGRLPAAMVKPLLLTKQPTSNCLMMLSLELFIAQYSRHGFALIKMLSVLPNARIPLGMHCVTLSTQLAAGLCLQRSRQCHLWKQTNKLADISRTPYPSSAKLSLDTRDSQPSKR